MSAWPGLPSLMTDTTSTAGSGAGVSRKRKDAAVSRVLLTFGADSLTRFAELQTGCVYAVSGVRVLKPPQQYTGVGGVDGGIDVGGAAGVEVTSDCTSLCF